MSKLQTHEICWQEYDDAQRIVWRSFDVRYEWDGEGVVIDGIWTNEDIYDLLTCPDTPKLLFTKIKTEIEDYEKNRKEELDRKDLTNLQEDLIYDRRKDGGLI